MEKDRSTRNDARDASELRKLRQEKEALSDQVKQLVKAETRLYEYQEELDAQLKEYENLYHLHRSFEETMDVGDIIALTLSYVMEKLDYQRVIFFQKRREFGTYAVTALDGYFDHAERDLVASLVIEDNPPLLAALPPSDDCMVCTADSSGEEIAAWRERLRMNEFLLYPLGARTSPYALLAVGNSAAQADFYRRITSDVHLRLGMGNLVGMVSSSLENRFFCRRLQEALQLKAESERKYRQLNDTLEQRIAEAVEESREKDRLLIVQGRQTVMGEMLNTIAHNWRQPLNTLGLIVQEMPVAFSHGWFSEGYLETCVRKIMDILGQMSRTIDDFGYFFRSDSTGIVRFRALEVVEKTVSLVKASFKACGIRIQVEATADLELTGRRNDFTQVLVNILNNARDAFLKGTVEEPLIVVRLAAEGGRTVFTITDNAGGIPDKILDRIFEPYITTKVGHGTGLGLFMAKVIVERHMGGTLSARNTGHGAEFCIII